MLLSLKTNIHNETRYITINIKAILIYYFIKNTKFKREKKLNIRNVDFKQSLD